MGRTVAIVGPTAVGKTSLALELNRHVRIEVINADAMQVYRGFDIGTAKPTARELEALPHHLIGVLEPQTQFSAGMFVRMARPVIAQVHQRGAVAAVVGGSGLYHQALFEGLSPIPQVPREIRRALLHELESQELADLYRELRAVDPVLAERLRPSDRQRILRGLEVYRATQRPLSEWQLEKPRGPVIPVEWRIGLTVARSLLYDLIEDRVRDMVNRGWLEEVASLLRSGVEVCAPAFRAIGYRELASAVRGESTLEEALEATIRATRRYAKRQMTWFRRSSEIRWLEQPITEEDVSMLVRQLQCDRASA